LNKDEVHAYAMRLENRLIALQAEEKNLERTNHD